MAIAALWGTIVDYVEHGKHVTIETSDGRMAVVTEEAFDHLYYRLDEFRAALKENCIEYAIFSEDKPICYYPDWFILAVNNGDIFVEDGVHIFYEDSGDIAMSPNSVILRNFMGQLKYIESDTFGKFYDTLE